MKRIPDFALVQSWRQALQQEGMERDTSTDSIERVISLFQRSCSNEGTDGNKAGATAKLGGNAELLSPTTSLNVTRSCVSGRSLRRF